MTKVVLVFYIDGFKKYYVLFLQILEINRDIEKYLFNRPYFFSIMVQAMAEVFVLLFHKYVLFLLQSIYLFLWVLRHFQHCTGHITTGSWKGRGNQYIQFMRVMYCKLPTNDKQLPAFPLEAVLGIEPQPQRWEARVLPLCHRDPLQSIQTHTNIQSEINKLALL